ncbi:MAG: TldD/PmbA family protein [Planctomycetes bacterium]|nr:TldD/PmbA family protein [Planctomycetota bacterium]
MKKLLLTAIETANTKKATYADARVVNEKNELIRVKNSEILEPTMSESSGIGIRVIVDGAWGFASTSDLSVKSITKTAVTAIEIAKASAKLKKENIELSKEEVFTDKWQTPYKTDPFDVPMEQKVNTLVKVNEILKKAKQISVAESSMSFTREHKYFASSEGAFIEQIIVYSGCGYSATAISNGDAQIRSYPMSFGGEYESAGYELIDRLQLLQNAEKTRDEAVALLTAKTCPSGKMDLILLPSQMVLQIHESVGHPTELDRVFGTEESYAGKSFVTTEKYRNFKYGSEIVNLVADNQIETGLATAGYDDDGVPAQKWHIVKNGQFVGYQTNREFAPRIGDAHSTGNNRADGFNKIPIIRIANLYLMPGTGKLKELIAGVKHGIIMDNTRSWSIDQLRYNFQFGCEIGWEINDGKITGIVKNPTYQGITPEFWSSCDATCGQDEWKLLGVANCGKGQPGQVARMSHGAAPTRFRNVTIGVR